jgi:hypothetical protein
MKDPTTLGPLLERLLANPAFKGATLKLEDLGNPDPKVRKAANALVRSWSEKHTRHAHNSVSTGLALGLVLAHAKIEKPYLKAEKKEQRNYATYALDTFGVSESYAHSLPVIASEWAAISDEPIKPSSLDSIRHLKPLTDPVEKGEAWREAVAVAGGSAPDAKQVEEVVRVKMGKSKKEPAVPKSVLLAKEVLGHIDAQNIDEARSRLRKEIESHAQRSPNPEPVEDPQDHSDDIEGFSFKRYPAAIVVTAPPVAHPGLIKLGFTRNENDGSLQANKPTYKEVGEDVFLKTVQEMVRASIAKSKGVAA